MAIRPSVLSIAERPTDRTPPGALAVSGGPGPADDLLLKVSPPRLPRDLVTRSRLLPGDPALRDHPIVLVQAAAGFGKTSLLAQWRREHLAHGAIVAWVMAQAQDTPQRLVRALALSVRTGIGRATFGRALLDATPASGLEGVTAWLAEVAQAAIDVVLFVDEADRLPADSRATLVYLLRNSPPNLRVVVAARSACHIDIDGLVDYGQCAVITQAMLCFQFEETLELVAKRCGNRVDTDTAARLHELTEGWPLGLQLALAAIDTGGAAPLGAASPTARGDQLHEHFVGMLLANLDPTDVDLLTRLSILEHLHADLCHALVPAIDTTQRLARMVRETPIFIGAEGNDWMRMHKLARDVLRQRFKALPADERASVHARAAHWLSEHGMVQDAALHAYSAGQQEQAYKLAERSLYDSLMLRGHQSVVLEWLDILPAEELDRRPQLQLAAAWSLALSERHDEAERVVARILAQPGIDDAMACECAMVRSGAAVFADEPDRFAMLHDPWAVAPPLRNPLLLKVHANRSAYRCLLAGDPALARLRQQQASRNDPRSGFGYLSRWSDFIVGLSYLWEGQVELAEKMLRPALALAEAELGRRSPFSAMLAAQLAAAVWECDRPVEAAALLADRMDVLERSGLPETVLLGFRTAARIAVAEGAENRAIELLGAMRAVGVARGLPRLCIASVAEQVRLHARRFRAETCRALCAEIDALMAAEETPDGPLWLRSVEVLRDVAAAYAAIAAQEWRRAIEMLARADDRAQQVKLGRLHIELLGLRAFALDRCGEKSVGLLREAADLAQTYGLRRVFDDAHPALGDWARQVLVAPDADLGRAGPLVAPMRAPRDERDAAPVRASPSLALTPKEREVLELLARNLSNKEIGLAMQVGEATIKWHLKNLFLKLDAGTRKQVVQRSRILGLLEFG